MQPIVRCPPASATHEIVTAPSQVTQIHLKDGGRGASPEVGAARQAMSGVEAIVPFSLTVMTDAAEAAALPATIT